MLCIILMAAPSAANAADDRMLDLSIESAERAAQEGRLATAEELFLAAIGRADALGLRDARLARSLKGLANVYRAQGRPELAEPLLRRAVIAEGAAPATAPVAPAPDSPIAPPRLAAARRIVGEITKEAAQIPDLLGELGLGAVTLVFVQARAGDIGGLQRTLSFFPPDIQFAPEVGVGPEVAAARARAGDVAGAMAMIASSPFAEVRGRAYAGVVRAQVEVGNVTGALKTAAAPELWNLRGALRLEIAWTQADLRDTRGAMTTLAPLRGIAEAEALIALLHARLGSVGEAARIAERIPLRESTYRALILLPAHRARTGDMTGAWRAVRAMAGAQRGFAEIGVILGEAERGDVGAARSSIAQLDALNQDAAYASLARLQAQKGDVVGAKQTAGVIKDASSLWSAYQHIAVAQAARGDLAGALQTAQEPNAPSTTLAAVAAAQAESGSVSAAGTTAQSLPDEKDRRAALVGVSVARAKAGDPGPLLALAAAQSPVGARLFMLIAAAMELLMSQAEERERDVFRTYDFELAFHRAGR
jgi:tetratricopeptide (TPR) repeat protein